MYASRAEGYGRSGLVGTALLTVGVLVFNVFFGLLSAVMLPDLATRAHRS
jgi:ABC-type phosphate transport system permease subunit